MYLFKNMNERLQGILFCYLDKPSMTDLCCFWTVMNNLPPRNGALQVKFQEGDSPLPIAETCFYTLCLPTVHESYNDFKKFMDIALTYDSLGIDHS